MTGFPATLLPLQSQAVLRQRWFGADFGLAPWTASQHGKALSMETGRLPQGFLSLFGQEEHRA